MLSSSTTCATLVISIVPPSIPQRSCFHMCSRTTTTYSTLFDFRGTAQSVPFLHQFIFKTWPRLDVDLCSSPVSTTACSPFFIGHQVAIYPFILIGLIPFVQGLSLFLCSLCFSLSSTTMALTDVSFDLTQNAPKAASNWLHSCHSGRPQGRSIRQVSGSLREESHQDSSFVQPPSLFEKGFRDG